MKNKILIIFSLSLLLFGCGTKAVMMTVTRPAEINLKGYDKIAVTQVVNKKGRVDNHSENIAEEITAQLVSSSRFDVVDRQHLKDVIKEQSLALTGMLDETSAPEIGKLLGVSAMIFGRVQHDKYTEETSTDKPTTDKKGKKHIKKHRRGKYSVNLSLKLIDVETAKILLVKNISVQKSAHTSAVDKTPAKIDKNPLFKQCVISIGSKFIRMVAPYQIRVKASFETDDELPKVDRAVAMFKVGEWSDGIKLLESATKKKKLKKEIRAKAFYNLGLAQVYQGQYDPAMENIKKAINLNPKSSRYMNALRNAKNEKKKAEELEQQL